MVRLRDCEPVPHDVVQAVQAPKAEVAQWIGHGPWLHDAVSAVCGQAAPPNCGCTTVRARLLKPAPHDVVHVLNTPKAGALQSIGQLWALQLRVSALCGQALPPLVGSVVERERLCAPMPHDLVQVVEAPKLPITQSAAQACALHERASFLCGQAAPPLVGSVVERERLWTPVPHDWVHALQALNEATTQSVGQAISLQSRVSSRYGHT
jgi:hypothetical protein